MEFKRGGGIWEGLKSYDSAQAAVVRLTSLLLASHNSDSQSVNRLPKSIIALLFVVVICILLYMCSCCHALDSFANKIYDI